MLRRTLVAGGFLLMVGVLALALPGQSIRAQRAAAATPLNANLLVNPGAEDGAAASDTNDYSKPIPGWKRLGSHFTAIPYSICSSSGCPGLREKRKIGGGNNMFSAGPDAEFSQLQQNLLVSGLNRKVDSGHIVATLSGYVATLDSDQGKLVVRFISGTGKILGSVESPIVQGTDLKWKKVTVQGKLPAGTRRLRVVMVGMRYSGFYVDAYFDNLDLQLKQQ